MCVWRLSHVRLIAVQGRTITPALYSNTIAPLFRKYGTPVERRTVWLKRRLLSGVSAIHRKLSVAAVQASLPSAELSGE